ncbi:hypothetical protein HDU91_003192, partial [Kappamyces sp. JEL0680]
SLYSFVGEGIPDFAIDGIIGFFLLLTMIGYLPAMVRIQGSRVSKTLWLLWLATALPLCLLFPYSADRPFHYGYAEQWDITEPQSHVSFTVMPTGSRDRIVERLVAAGVDIFPKQLQWTLPRTFAWTTSDIPRLDAQHHGSAQDLIALEWTRVDTGRLAGLITGSPGSRVCDIRPSVLPTTYMIDEEEHWSIQERPDWKAINGSLVVMRESYPTHRTDARIEIPFDFRFAAGVDARTVVVTVGCHHEIRLESPTFKHLLATQPSWLSRQIKRRDFRTYGDLILSKTFGQPT